MDDARPRCDGQLACRAPAPRSTRILQGLHLPLCPRMRRTRQPSLISETEIGGYLANDALGNPLLPPGYGEHCPDAVGKRVHNGVVKAEKEEKAARKTAKDAARKVARSGGTVDADAEEKAAQAALHAPYNLKLPGTVRRHVHKTVAIMSPQELSMAGVEQPSEMESAAAAATAARAELTAAEAVEAGAEANYQRACQTLACLPGGISSTNRDRYSKRVDAAAEQILVAMDAVIAAMEEMHAAETAELKARSPQRKALCAIPVHPGETSNGHLVPSEWSPRWCARTHVEPSRPCDHVLTRSCVPRVTVDRREPYAWWPSSSSPLLPSLLAPPVPPPLSTTPPSCRWIAAALRRAAAAIAVPQSLPPAALPLPSLPRYCRPRHLPSTVAPPAFTAIAACPHRRRRAGPHCIGARAHCEAAQGRHRRRAVAAVVPSRSPPSNLKCKIKYVTFQLYSSRF